MSQPHGKEQGNPRGGMLPSADCAFLGAYSVSGGVRLQAY